MMAYRVLQALAAALVVVTLALLAWPPSVPPLPPVPPASIEAASPPAAAPALSDPALSDPALSDSIVLHDIFSRTRRPPRTRYAPAAGGVAGDAPTSWAPQPPADTTGAPAGSSGAAGDEPSAQAPRLYGVVAGALGATALIDLDPTVPGAELYRAGDTRGGWRVVAIAGDSVVLTGPRGRRVLHLKEKTP